MSKRSNQLQRIHCKPAPCPNGPTQLQRIHCKPAPMSKRSNQLQRIHCKPAPMSKRSNQLQRIHCKPAPLLTSRLRPTSRCSSQVIICTGDLGDVSTTTTCHNCGHRVQTRVVYHSGVFAWMICGFCIMFG
ncbi:hypothetical protein ACEWY4_017075 [Coilia grayii]|uniref:LITAF domain-containing protein n=1 Tax=Coilia grayii TaxID=363190 RepID=A0ABD1JIR4_9TELE